MGKWPTGWKSALSEFFSCLLLLLSITVLQILSPYCCSVFHSWQIKSWEKKKLCRVLSVFIRQYIYFFTDSLVLFLIVHSWAERFEVLLMFLFCQCFVGISTKLQLVLIWPDRPDAKNFHRNSRLKFRSTPLLCSRGINYAWICQLQWVSKHCPIQSSILSTSLWAHILHFICQYVSKRAFILFCCGYYRSWKLHHSSRITRQIHSL